MKTIFNERYDRDNYLDFLENYLLPDDFKIKEENVTNDISFDSNRISGITYLGHSEILDLSVYEITHKSEFDPRVSLSKDAFRMMANFSKRKALIFFIPESSINYRFSLITIDLDIKGKKIQRLYSNPRRYSFLLGSEAKLGTIYDKLLDSKTIEKAKRISDLNDLKERFSVESVSIQFFKEYKELYEEIKKTFNNIPNFKIVEAKHIDSNFIELFSRKLLGQIVFIYFLQRKKWLGGDPTNKEWKDGKLDFLHWAFDYCTKNNLNFFDKFLEKLFYKGFNEKGASFEFNGTFIKVPFLNGGLFEKFYMSDETLILHPPNSLFSNNDKTGILDILDKYNFTIDENTFFEQEVAVDPEMLGKVFENLLPENLRKGKGAFYTPREIVSYMTRESLINYLKTKLDNSDNNSETLEKKIRHLFEYKDYYISKKESEEMDFEKQFYEMLDIVEDVNKYLSEIRIVDPAVGSGAFPMGILLEIVSLREYIEKEFLNNNIITSYELKRDTIQNSIYGVDLDPGAVEIAKLRFWLSLVVDAENPEALPNLDYKIMQGNSLIESFAGIDVGKSKEFKQKVAQEQITKLQAIIKKFNNEISKLQTETLDAFRTKKPEAKSLMNVIQKKQKEKQKKEKVLNKLIREFETEEFDKSESELIFKIHQKQKLLFRETDRIRKEQQRIEIENLIVKLFESKLKFVKQEQDSVLKIIDDKLTGILNLKDRLSIEQREKNKYKELFKIDIDKAELELHQYTKKDRIRPFFPWHLYFADIFEEGGFDIVIANPPYLKERENASIFKPVNQSPLGIKYHCGKMDYWFYFLHKAIDISKDNSIITYITSRYWLNSDGARKIINHIQTDLTFLDLVDIGKLKVFDNVVGHHMIACYNKNKANAIFKYKKLVNSVTDINSNTNTEHIEISNLDNNNVFQDNEILLTKRDFNFSNCKSLGDICKTSIGVQESPDKISKKLIKKLDNDKFQIGDGIFVINKRELGSLSLNQEELEIIKKYLDPNDISKYFINFDEEYLIYSDKVSKKEIESNPKYARIKKHLSNFKSIITSSNAPYGLHRPRELKYFDSPKIIFKNMFKEPEFCLDNENYYFGFSFSSIIQDDKQYDLKYILSILNSRFAQYWFYKYGKMRGVGVDIGVKKLRKFPIKKNVIQQNLFIKLVDQILQKKKQKKDTQHLENQIDLMVYKLYDLTYEEIKIVDAEFDKVLSEFSLSKADYERMSVEELGELEV